ncbi:Swi5-domain-containing protein [Colletotrichum navitas]|uniref:Swi5-domain-containing protein n=1 Tax=Colletotrichum navitas TaxID=681940 RepID=A0AAD8PL45_9PEZI|nr:Swi5-domain-containing protein [Colletotrichum navitas]KAK1566200.1 Swi5-domain-containing protein [Colletotrichum navitas]
MGSSKPDGSLTDTSCDTGNESARNVTQDECQNENSAKMKEKNDKEFEEASAVVARHVKLLREYNEIKDVGQQLMGMVAEMRGVTVGSLYRTGEFGVGPKD